MALRVWRVWRSQESTPLSERTRGAVLRDALTELGPVFVKCGQARRGSAGATPAVRFACVIRGNCCRLRKRSALTSYCCGWIALVVLPSCLDGDRLVPCLAPRGDARQRNRHPLLHAVLAKPRCRW